MASEIDIVSLKKSRAVLKGSCTRIGTFVDQCTNITAEITAQLEERRIALDKYATEYEQVQLQLELIDSKEEADRPKFEESYYALRAKIRRKLSVVQVASAHGERSGLATPTSEAGEVLTHVRLPQLNLPTFSGRYDEWFPFHDTFLSIIHANTTLSDIQKLQYLKASVTGDAGDIIKNLELSGANYEVAWTLLRERYSNKRIVVQTHIRAIMELPSLTRENAVDLRKISDGAKKHIRALGTLKCPTDKWDDLIVYILSAKFDAATGREWQASLKGPELPSLTQLLEFVSHRCQVLEASAKVTCSSAQSGQSKSQFNNKKQTAYAATVHAKCLICDGNHPIFACNKFINFTVPQRINEIRSRKLCTNCLRATNHKSSACKSGTCKMCNLKHNTLLHLPNNDGQPRDEQENDQISEDAPQGSTLAAHSSISSYSESVLLSTAVIHVYNAKGELKSARALLDSGSQANFVTKRLLQRLQLKAKSTNVIVSGINGTESNNSQIADIKIKSRQNSFNSNISCIVTDRITELIPNRTMKLSSFEIPKNITLADPQFHVASEIDMLIGADLFYQIMSIGQIRASSKHPTLQKTRFGWVLGGKFANAPCGLNRTRTCHARVTNVDLQQALSRFWSIDEINNKTNEFTAEEQGCERHFVQHAYQNKEGRFVVQLPLKEDMINKIGESRSIATKRLINLEKRLARDDDLSLQYNEFLKQYLILGHMKLVQESAEPYPVVYLPHHCVIKDTSITTKLRVVFDASCKTTTGISLNDVLKIGPVVQQDLISIILRFRTHKYVITADIIKMYRQILIDPSQTRLQRILWRDDPANDINVYELNTVTYGTASASYLATKCLQHLATIFADKYPVGAEHVKRDFYMDDLLTGGDTIASVLVVKNETIELLKLGAFELSKWAFNCPKLIDEFRSRDNSIVNLNKDLESRVLGILWNAQDDTLRFSYNAEFTDGHVTKRTITSDTAKLFDPLGLLGPVIVIAKIMLQELWQSNLSWDESVPMDIHMRWTRFREQLSSVKEFHIPRQAKHSLNPSRVQIHGFCDASQLAYGACVYLRSELTAQEYRTELLCSKSRVAPIKAVSLPRLELCAALLLSRLIDKIRHSFDTKHMTTYLWSDSTITLNWIASSSRKWSTFVANRVGEIQTLTSIDDWRHVPTAENPADLISRGADPSDLINSSLWWHGPRFLTQIESVWPAHDFTGGVNEMPEQRTTLASTIVTAPSVVEQLTNKFSSLHKVARIIAYCIRFAKRDDKRDRFISPTELKYAILMMCRVVQKGAFPDDYESLSKGNWSPSSSKSFIIAVHG